MGLLDLLFPKRCVVCKKIGDYLCSHCFAKISFDVEPFCLICTRPAFGGFTHPSCIKKYGIDGTFAGLAYTGVVKKLVYTFKYKPYLFDLGNFLTELLYESIIQQESFHHVLTLYGPSIIPIPLSRKKLRSRGYNQAAILGKKLAKKCNLFYSDCLERVKDTKPLFGLKKEERKKNISQAFRYTLDIKEINNPYAFLVDDLLTTGTTLLEATEVLKRKGYKKVWGICLAKDV